MVDLVIPLGSGSKYGNDELRLFLRSVEKYGRGIRNIIVVTEHPPKWLTGVKIIPCGDPLPHNKDGNIIAKILKAAADPDLTPEFVWSADDCALLQPLNLELLPPIFNSRKKEAFPANGSIWQRRVRRTFDFLEARGIRMIHNFESHTPQRFHARKLLRAMAGIDYCSNIGYSVDTLFFGLLGITDGFDQRLFKETCETASGWKLNQMLLGYNDSAFQAGLRNKLLETFNKPSKYEVK